MGNFWYLRPPQSEPFRGHEYVKADYTPSVWDFTFIERTPVDWDLTPTKGAEIEHKLSNLTEALIEREGGIVLLMTRKSSSPPASECTLSLSDIIERLGLPAEFLHLHMPFNYIGSGNFYSEKSYDSNGAESTMSSVAHFPMILDGVNHDDSYLSIAIKYDIKTNVTVGLIHGTTLAFQDMIISYLRNTSNNARHPLYLPIAILDLVSRHTTSLWGEHRLKVWDMEAHSGIAYTRSGDPWSWANKKVQEVIQDNFKTMTNLKFFQRALDFEGNYAAFLLDSLKAIEGPLETVDRHRYANHVSRGLEEKTINLRNIAQNQLNQALSLESRAQNLLNIILAITAQKTSQSAYEDNQIMREISIATKKDSSSMITIALLTMFFLPATFVASLFSTGMFNLAANPGEAFTSQRSWVYWAIAIPLTVLVIAIWFGWYVLVRQNRKVVTLAV